MSLSPESNVRRGFSTGYFLILKKNFNLIYWRDFLRINFSHILCSQENYEFYQVAIRGVAFCQVLRGEDICTAIFAFLSRRKMDLFQNQSLNHNQI